MTTRAEPGLQRALDMMDRVLRPGRSLAAEFPLIFRDEFAGRVVALGDGQHVRSACAVLERDFVMGGDTVRVGLIGSVSTDAASRHQGLATRVLSAAEDQLRSGGCLISVLWADDPRFYFARGYRPMGWEVDFAVDSNVAAKLPRTACRPAREADVTAIHRLYANHSHRVARTERETAALLACPGMKTLVSAGEGGLAAYACLGRGDDLAGTIHEWGGVAENVLSLVRAHHEAWTARSDSRGLFVMVPPSEAGLRERLAELGAPASDGILGLGKLLDRSSALRLLHENATLATVEDCGANTADLTGTRGTAEIDDVTLFDLLFAPRGERTLHERVERTSGAKLTRLPLRPFAWGLDSI